MKYFIEKIYLLVFLVFVLLIGEKALSKENKAIYTKKNISNYFSGVVAVDNSQNTEAFKYLSEASALVSQHSNYNINFVKTLVLLNKFEEAFSFSKNLWLRDKFYFETGLLLGVKNFAKGNYLESEKYFRGIQENFKSNLYFEDLLLNILISWTKAHSGNEEESFETVYKIPNEYDSLKQIQYSFLHCYFDNPQAETYFQDLVKKQNYNFSRYNFFLANYLIYKKRNVEAEKLIESATDISGSNLLIKQTRNFIKDREYKKIKYFFNCKNPKDSLAEIFYLVANIYSSNQNYKLSNFYLNISLFLNSKFKPNNILLAENSLSEKKNDLSKKIYKSLKSIGSIYSWHSSLSVARILTSEGKKDSSILNLQKDFDNIADPNHMHYYELANFYKENEYYKESIKYYSLALQEINQNSSLVPKILERRGTSYERSNQWKKAEKDLLESLSISPEQPYVLNYLAYTWIERKENITKALEMLKRAVKMKKNDGYIIDSLGWAYYKRKNYVDAEKYLQMAVEIFPLDPIINDHYADALWMQNKNIQARYFWEHVLNLKTTEPELKDKISKKIIFGINNNL